jgi:1,4-alpha-glucan branching enzyme
MRILHVSSEYPPQQIFGLGRYVADLSRHLAKLGHGVHVLTNSMGGPDQEIVQQGVYVHRVDFPPPPMPPSAGGPVMAFNLHLQQRAHALGRAGLGDPEVVVSHDWLTVLAGHRIAARFRIPHVWTVHDTVYGKRGGRHVEPEDPLTSRIELWAAKVADLLLVNSLAIGEEILGAYRGDPSRMALLHPGVDPDQFTLETSPARLAAFRQLFAEPEETLITYSGRLDQEKGIDTLINAFSLLKRHHPRIRLAIVGRGRLQPMIEEHIKKLDLAGAVGLYGYLQGPVLKHYYKISDIHVCPSHYEPFGLVAVEAMAWGVPVVASATGGLREIISSPSVGRTFPPANPGALVEVLGELVRNPELRKELGLKGQAHALKNFSWATLAERAAQLYASLAQPRKKSA